MPADGTQEVGVTKLTIQGLPFEYEPPFVEGHPLTAVEASVLNQTHAENVRNNFAATIKAMKAEVAKTNSLFKKVNGEDVPDIDQVSNDDLDLDAVQAAFEKYVDEYEFGARRAGGTRTPADPVAKEARRIAREKVTELLKAKNYKISEVPKETMDSLIDQALEQYPEIKETAQALVASAKSISLADLKI